VTAGEWLLELIVATFQLFEFLDWLLTSLAFAGVLGVVVLLAGVFGILRSRLAYARHTVDVLVDEPVGAE
jgi:hypothetical protein